MISKHNINMSVRSDKKLFSSKARVSEKHESLQPGRSVVSLKGIFFIHWDDTMFLILRLFMWCIALINLHILKHHISLGWSQFLHNVRLFWCFWFRLQLFSCELFCLCSIKKLVYSGVIVLSLFYFIVSVMMFS